MPTLHEHSRHHNETFVFEPRAKGMVDSERPFDVAWFDVPQQRKGSSATAWLRCNRGEHECLYEFRLPLQTFQGFTIIYPLSPSLLALEPFRIHATDVEFVEMIRRACAINGSDVFRDRSAYARYYVGKKETAKDNNA